MGQVRAERAPCSAGGGDGVRRRRAVTGPAWVAGAVLALAAAPAGAQQGTEVSLAANLRDWSAPLPAWEEYQLALKQATRAGDLIGRFSRVARAGLTDERVEAEFYPRFRGGYAALAIALAPDATLYPSSVVSGELFRSIAERTEASLGYRRMDYSSAVDIVTASLGRYHRAYLFTLRATHILDDGTTGHLSARRYFSDEGTYLGAHIATGSGPVLILSPSDFESRFSRSAGVEGRWIGRTGWVLGGQLVLAREGLSGGGESGVTNVVISVGRRF